MTHEEKCVQNYTNGRYLKKYTKYQVHIQFFNKSSIINRNIRSIDYKKSAPQRLHKQSQRNRSCRQEAKPNTNTTRLKPKLMEENGKKDKQLEFCDYWIPTFCR